MRLKQLWDRVIQSVQAECSHLEGRYSMLDSGNDAKNYCRFYRRNKGGSLYYSIVERPVEGVTMLEAEVFIQRSGAEGEACQNALREHADRLGLGLQFDKQQAGDHMGYRVYTRVEAKTGPRADEYHRLWFTYMVLLFDLHFGPELDNY